MSCFKIAFKQTNNYALESIEDVEELYLQTREDDGVIKDELIDSDRTTDTVDGLIAIAEMLAEKTGNPTALEKQMYSLAGRFAVAGTAMESDMIVPSLESYDQMRETLIDRITIAQESVTDSLMNLWESFANIMKKFFNRFRSLQGKLDAVEKQIDKIKGYGGERTIEVQINSGIVKSHTESFDKMFSAIATTINNNTESARSIIVRGISFSTSGNSLLDMVKKDKDQRTNQLVEDTYDQFYDIFGPKLASDLGYKKQTSHGNTEIYLSDTDIYGDAFELTISTKPPAQATADIYVRAAKVFNFEKVSTQEDLTSGKNTKVSWTVSADDLKQQIRATRTFWKQIEAQYRDYDKVYSKFTALIHKQRKISIHSGANDRQDNTGIALNLLEVGAAGLSALKGNNELNRLNTQIGRSVVGVLTALVYQISPVADLSLSLLSKLAYDSTWHKNKTEE